ncbi:retropepsin-like aspartic protease [Actinoallomurus rhizosphaericola]|uniref:retropepsin-like aspartic protease n=1 Tax=Actinoallomurus rhizosphaericola TaxID=2952536 RepID=UPI0020937CB3|nr:retropepsin-like aspartic protease [Actinoallomurus rhizosphaericola]MCO5996409.1 retroviral-like aspartic protease family protein [Actinoallomurus rhizosphaericola]
MSRTMITRLLLAALLPLAAGCAETRARPAADLTVGTPAGSARMRTSPVRSAPVSPGVPDPFETGKSFSLPMRVIHSGDGTLLFVPVRVNGTGPYDFVLDTGSSNSSVDRSLVRRLRLPRTGQEHRVQGVTGSGLVPIVKIRRWTIGGVPLRATSLAVVDLGMGVAGLLGSDELRHFSSVTLDFQHDRIDFRR